MSSQNVDSEYVALQGCKGHRYDISRVGDTPGLGDIDMEQDDLALEG